VTQTAVGTVELAVAIGIAFFLASRIGMAAAKWSWIDVVGQW